IAQSLCRVSSESGSSPLALTSRKRYLETLGYHLAIKRPRRTHVTSSVEIAGRSFKPTKQETRDESTLPTDTARAGLPAAGPVRVDAPRSAGQAATGRARRKYKLEPHRQLRTRGQGARERDSAATGDHLIICRRDPRFLFQPRGWYQARQPFLCRPN